MGLFGGLKKLGGKILRGALSARKTVTSVAKPFARFIPGGSAVLSATEGFESLAGAALGGGSRTPSFSVPQVSGSPIGFTPSTSMMPFSPPTPGTMTTQSPPGFTGRGIPGIYDLGDTIGIARSILGDLVNTQSGGKIISALAGGNIAAAVAQAIRVARGETGTTPQRASVFGELASALQGQSTGGGGVSTTGGGAMQSYMQQMLMGSIRSKDAKALFKAMQSGALQQYGPIFPTPPTQTPKGPKYISPPGYVTVEIGDEKYSVVRPFAKCFGYKTRSKPVLTRADVRKLRRYGERGTVQKRVKKIASDAGLKATYK
jgi:hypothetical protein